MSIADWTERDARALADKILGHSKAPECELSLHPRAILAHPLRRQRRHHRGVGRGPAHHHHQPGQPAFGQRHRQRAQPRRRCSGGGPQRGADGPGPGGSGVRRGPAHPEVPQGGRLLRRDRPRRRPGAPGRGEGRPGPGPPAEELQALGLLRDRAAALSAVANKKGNFGFHAATSSEYSTTMRTADGTGSGWGGGGGPRLNSFRPAELAARAAPRPGRRPRPARWIPGATR